MERYVLRGGRWGYERLQMLARVRRADTLELLRRVGLRPGMRCLDLGCGGGEVTFEIAQLVRPGGSVVGIDMDEVKLALARKAADEQDLSNVEFRAANVNDWAEPDAYDLVYGRFLLQRLTGRPSCCGGCGPRSGPTASSRSRTPTSTGSSAIRRTTVSTSTGSCGRGSAG